jgi:hypothetical protein
MVGENRHCFRLIVSNRVGLLFGSRARNQLQKCPVRTDPSLPFSAREWMIPAVILAPVSFLFVLSVPVTSIRVRGGPACLHRMESFASTETT